MTRPDPAVADPTDDPEPAALDPMAELVHACPEAGRGLTPCCGRTPFELPPWHSRMTLDPDAVTCPGEAAARAHEARQARAMLTTAVMARAAASLPGGH